MTLNKFLYLLLTNLNCLFPDKIYLKIFYRLMMGERLNLDSPKTFTEKIQWLKLNNKKAEYTLFVDKYAVKDYVATIIGEEHIIPTIGVWDKPDDIVWESLPNQFVLKTTHGGGGGGVLLCKNKNTFKKKEAIKILTSSLKRNSAAKYREYQYYHVPRRIIAEQYMEDNNSDNKDLIDYKFYCFSGKPTYCQVIKDRQTHETIDFFDMKWNHMPFVGLNPNAENSVFLPTKPICLNQMIEISAKLSSNIPFVRIDLYEINGKVYFGEMTFSPASGFGKFRPQEWDVKLGDLLNIECF